MFKVYFLGTAASIATGRRDNTSLLLYINRNDFILVDCPGSIVQKLSLLKIDFRKLTQVIITHTHPDHIYGLISLIHSQFKTTRKLTLYSSKNSIRIINRLIKIFSFTSRDYPQIYFKDVFKTPFFLKRKEIKISAFKNKHTPGSFGIKISFNHKETNLVYSSDTAINQNIRKLINKNTYLIHDCTASSCFFKKYPSLQKMHTDSLTLKKLAETTKPKVLIPIHYLLLEKRELESIKKELSSCKCKVFFPEDFSSLKLE